MKNIKKISILFISLFIFSLVSSGQEKEQFIQEKINNYKYEEALGLLKQDKESDKNRLLFLQCYEGLQMYADAIRILEFFCDNMPNDVKWQMQLADIYTKASMPDKSLALYQKLLKSDKDNTFYMIKEADVLYFMQDYASALTYYKQINSRIETIDNLRKIAICYENTNKPDSARLCYENILTILPNDYFATISLTNVLMKQKNYVSAISLSNSYLAIDSLNKQMVLYNALSNYHIENYKESIRKFEKLVSVGDTSLIVVRGLGMSHVLLQDDFYEAREYLKRAYDQDTTHASTIFYLARSCAYTSYPQEAVNYYTKLLSIIVPETDMMRIIYTDMGTAYNNLKDVELALKSYESALNYTIDEDNLYLLHYRLAVNYSMIENYQLAIKYFELTEKYAKEKVDEISAELNPALENELERWNKNLESAQNNIKKVQERLKSH